MSPFDVEIIQRKLAVILDNLKALEPIQRMERDEYLRDLYKRKATERLLQELIEAAIDINTHMIVGSGYAAPDDYYQSFIRAAEIGIISPDLSEKLAPSAGLRNRLVHEYDRIEHSIILEAVGMAEEFYPRYVKEVSDTLSGIGKG
ncbi:MAG: DUF86 domain-containing protein [Thermodesulfobacteriota bacterium]|jgi:uncharacterized protein YutE (UPF0331/DUF86 family)